MRRGRVDGDLAGEHDLLERARADALDGAGDGLLVVLGRGDARDPEAPGGRGIEQRQRPLAQPGGARRDAVRELLGHVVGRGERRQREADLAVAARQRDLGDHELTGAEARPVRRGAALGREGEAADRDQAGARRPVGRARDRAAGERAPGRGDLGEAPRARRLEPAHGAERRQRRAAAIGLLEAEPVLARPRARRRRPRWDRPQDRRPRSARRAPPRRRAGRGGPRARSGAQLGARLRVERERAAGGRDPDAHRPNQSRTLPQ